MDIEEEVRIAEPEGGYEFDPLSSRVISAALTVHKQLGPGYKEEIYENALCHELNKRGIACAKQVPIPVSYDGVRVGDHELDLLVEDRLIVEIKSVATLLEVHYAQLRGYLRAADKRVGLLLNFGDVPLTIKRLVNKY